MIDLVKLLIIGCLSVSYGLSAQQSVLPLFASDSVLELEISFSFDDCLKDIKDKRSLHKSVLTYNGISIPLNIRTRGHFRRQARVCDFPPLKLYFDSTEVVGSLFEGLKKLKLVTHCRSKKEKLEQCLLQEYLVYQAYELFTPESFKTRLLKITYTDADGKNFSLHRYGFFLEPTSIMAKRNASKVHRRLLIHPDDAEREKGSLLAVFEYMVGNTDWSVSKCHNVKLIENSVSKANPIAVPYDFDWCGIVNAPYAQPLAMLEIGSVKERLFRGFCRTEEEFETCFKVFREKKAELIALYQNQDGLSVDAKKKAVDYLEGFFKVINNPKLIKREFLERCRF